MKLIIAEKPSVANNIAEVLNVTERNNSYIKGNGYIITWCYGHLISLAEPKVYSEKYTKWSLEDLPIIPNKFELEVNNNTKEHFYLIQKLMNREDVTEVICATDSGREGELIFRLVYEKAECKKPIKRLWISSITEEAIKNGFENLRDGADYEDLYQSAIARAKADWLIGMNLSRLYTLLYNSTTSVGRVVTPTLAMLVHRKEMIDNHIKEKSYNLLLTKDNLVFISNKSFEEKEKAEEIAKRIKNNKAICSFWEREEKTESTPKLYDLTSLQKDANKIFGYSAAQTLEIIQELYEKKILTYPRTDSKFISDDMENEVIEIVNVLYYKFLNDTERVVNVQNVINNDKITDHHAIIPTKNIARLDIENLCGSNKNILVLVCKRLLEATYKNAKRININIQFNMGELDFYTSYSYTAEKGYLNISEKLLNMIDIVVKNINTIENKEFIFSVGDILENAEISLKEKETAPPKHFTEASLLSAMENAKNYYKQITDEDIDKKGLGTPATRADIIEKLIKNEYIERKEKNLIATEKGSNVIEIVDKEITSPYLTADWEVKLQKIEKGEYDSEIFNKEIKNIVVEKVKNREINTKIKEMLETKPKEREIIGYCPRCNGEIYEGEKGFYCSNKECKFMLWREDKFFTSKQILLDKDIASKLLNNEKVHIESIYSDKKNKYYSAKIYMVDTGVYTNYKIEF